MKSLGWVHSLEELVGIAAALGAIGNSQADQPLYADDRRSRPHPDEGAEGESGEKDREMQRGVQPVERSASIVQLAGAMVVRHLRSTPLHGS